MGSIKIIFIILGIIFWVVRTMSKSDSNDKVAPKKRAKQTPRPANTQKAKSIDDIFNEFVKEVENSKKKQVQAVKPKPKPVVAAAKKRTLDWQKVETTHIKPKEMLLDHEDYHGISHRVDAAHQVESVPAIVESEGEVFEFDTDNVDWKQAIVASEILGKRFS